MDRGSCGVGLGLTMVTREMGPVLQGWLEIREVEVEGIHHVTKPEVLERLALNPGMGSIKSTPRFSPSECGRMSGSKRRWSNAGRRICCMSPYWNARRLPLFGWARTIG